MPGFGSDSRRYTQLLYNKNKDALRRNEKNNVNNKQFYIIRIILHYNNNNINNNFTELRNNIIIK
jgi:hypothetical protein